MNLLQLLTDNGFVDAKAIPEIESELQKPGANAEDVLQKNGITLQNILKVKGDYYGLPTRELGGTLFAFKTLFYAPEESARHYHLAPIGVADGALEVGITDPDNMEARDALTFISAKV